MRVCPYCGDTISTKVKGRENTYLCSSCKRQFKEFYDGDGNLSVRDLTDVIQAQRQLVSVYMPKWLLKQLNERLTGDEKGRSITRSPFVVSSAILLDALMSNEELDDAADLLKKISKNPARTKSRLEQLAEKIT